MTRSARGRGSGTCYSCTAVAIALLALAAQLSAIGDLVLFRHAVCSEHGELIHLDEEVSWAAPPSANTHFFSIDAKAEPRVHHGHDHCSLAAHRRETTPASRAKILLARAEPIVAGCCLEDDVPRSAAVATFLLAPKNSPPA
jgi:hypothetical protein